MDRSQDWLEQAKNDLEHAKKDLEWGFYAWSCFSSQQSAEKAVKSVFKRMGAEAWGRAVADLLEQLTDKQDVPQQIIDIALELDKAYIPTRYPDAHPSGSPWKKYTKEEARRLVEYAETIVQFSENILSRM